MKKPFKETAFGKILGKILSVTADTNPVTKTIKKVIVGGTIESMPLSAFRGVLDINQDGKVNIKDLREIKWDDLAKLAVVGGVWFALHHFKVLSALGF
ncbi:hypothetical protein [Reichenbachiella sp.]|uniref:hypothetical protein n=1 Tax=Reichenbachiella sp. TaxID=2184521 RepID=UPI003B5C114E